MKKKKSMGSRITLAVMLVLAYGILSAGITGILCLVTQSTKDMQSSVSQRAAAAENLVSSTLYHYKSLIGSLDGTQAQIDRIMANDSNIVSVNTHADDMSGTFLSSDGYIMICGEYSKGNAAIATSTDWLQNISATLHTEDTEFYLLTGSGQMIAAVNGSMNQEEAAKYLGSTKAKTANIGGKNRVVYNATLEGTDWQTLVVCDSAEFFQNTNIAVASIIGSAIVAFTLGAIVIRKFVRRIIVPLNAINTKILDMSEGKLNTGDVEVNTGDELQTLGEAVNAMSGYTRVIIKDIEAVSEKLAAEDLTVQPAADYIGDYAPIKTALQGIITSTSGVIRQIEMSSRQVADGSEKMSGNSMTLSQAATEQAATVEELNASIVEISGNITANAESAGKAKELADDCRKMVDEGNVKMSDMLHAMEEINETSSQIANIIKTIEDISFQTNILSLNASIEAARAGEAGKGFAVVAGEVGQLAGKTAEAAKNTTALIKTSLHAVENGTVMANETASMLSKIVRETDDTAKVIDHIAAASKEQADSVKQILTGMDQISTSVQMTSGSSAECAASAEELSAQAAVLLQLVERFKVADEKADKKPAKPAAKKETPAKPAPRTEAKPEAKEEKKPAEPAAKPAPKAEADTEPKAEKPVPKAAPAPKTELRPAPKAEVKPAPKTEAKPAPKAPEAKPAEPVRPRARTIVLDDDKY